MTDALLTLAPEPGARCASLLEPGADGRLGAARTHGAVQWAPAGDADTVETQVDPRYEEQT